jgi:hypothetical protein
LSQARQNGEATLRTLVTGWVPTFGGGGKPQRIRISFPGDEIIGLTADADALRTQWRHWLDHEMGWLDRQAIPLWHTTRNHTTYDTMSEDVFREVLDLPRNGPRGQEGMSYWVRRGDLLLVFVHTLWTGLGGEGHVETEWLEGVLRQHADARHKLVLGHHPVYPVNGFSGPYQREIGPEYAGRFWDILVEADVLAYLCSHDTDGVARERLEWPMAPFSREYWRDIANGEGPAPITGRLGTGRRIEFRVRGRTAVDTVSSAQTLVSAFSPGSIAPVWIGFQGPRQTLTLIMGREPGG